MAKTGYNAQKGIILTLMVLTLVGFCYSRSLHKRDVVQMCRLINTYTNRSCWDYNDYGCFCGYGGFGGKPVDNVDRCCLRHDICYGQTRCYFWPQFVPFSYTCNSEERHCHCTDTIGSCYRQVCECDLELAKCIGEATYLEMHRNFDRSMCYSRGTPHL